VELPVTFDEAFAMLIGLEGNYTNHPADPGGETKYGVSKRAYPEVDIKSLTLDGAKAIYRRDYWNKLGMDSLPPEVIYSLFDCAVNSGINQACKLLQRAVGVKEDGVIGKVTIAQARALSPLQLVVRLNATRLQFMTELKGWESFGKGWARRVAEVLLESVK
jgi:lysozyme family protein